MENKCDDVNIRLSKVSDRDTIKDLVNRVHKKLTGHLYARYNDRLSDEGFQTYYDKKELFVAEKYGSVIGCVTMSPKHNDSVLVGMLVVREDLRKQGIGRQLMDHITKLASLNKSCKRILIEIYISTRLPDPWHRIYMPKFYHKQGYKFVDSMDLHEKYPSVKEVIAGEITVCTYEKIINY